MGTYLKEIRSVVVGVEIRLGNAALKEGMVLTLRSVALMKRGVFRAPGAPVATSLFCILDITPFSAMRLEFVGSIIAPHSPGSDLLRTGRPI